MGICCGTALRLLDCTTRGLCCIGSTSAKVMKKDVKMGYGLLHVLFSTLLFVLIYFGTKYLSFAQDWIGCPGGDENSSCIGLSSAYRLSFCLAIFHVLITLSCLTRDGFSKCVNEGFWAVKLFMVLGMFIGSLFIPIDFFKSYSQIAIYLSIIYLFAQLVSIIDAFYLVAEFWAKKMDNGNKCYGCILIFMTLIFYTGTGIVLYYSFSLFWKAGCGYNKALLIALAVLTVAFVVLVILKFHPKGSVITSGAISIYALYVAWTAFLSNPNKECNTVLYDNKSMIIQILSSISIGFFCTFYWSMCTKTSEGLSEAGVKNVNHEEVEPEKDEDFVPASKEDQTEEKYGAKGDNLLDREEQESFVAYQDNNYIKFHVFMALFSIYYCPLFSNWGYAKIKNQQSWDYGSNSWGPYSIKIFVAFFTMFLYLWTLVAPKILTNRKFE